MYKIVICDDDKSICDWLSKHVKELYGEKVELTTYTSLTDLESAMEQGNIEPDIIMMDIVFHKKNGIDCISQIQQKAPEIKVIFITGYIDYATEIFRVHPSHFLVKPLKEEKIKEALNKVMTQIDGEKNQKLYIQSRGHHISISYKDILFCESERRIITVHTKAEAIDFYGKMDELEKQLPDYFLRCHKSFLVNMYEIEKHKTEEVLLSDGSRISISRSRESECRERFLDFIKEL